MVLKTEVFSLTCPYGSNVYCYTTENRIGVVFSYYSLIWFDQSTSESIGFARFYLDFFTYIKGTITARHNNNNKIHELLGFDNMSTSSSDIPSKRQSK